MVRSLIYTIWNKHGMRYGIYMLVVWYIKIYMGNPMYVVRYMLTVWDGKNTVPGIWYDTFAA